MQRVIKAFLNGPNNKHFFGPLIACGITNQQQHTTPMADFNHRHHHHQQLQKHTANKLATPGTIKTASKLFQFAMINKNHITVIYDTEEIFKNRCVEIGNPSKYHLI